MALHDEILRDFMAGRVPWRFTTRDLKTIPGKKSRHFCVAWYGKCEYELVLDRQQDFGDLNPEDEE